MDFYPDILDHLGHAPRELGPVHLFVESVARDASARAVATLWLQSAFEPIPRGGVVRISSRHPPPWREVQRGLFRLPDVNGGKVLRWRVPLELPGDATEIVVKVEVEPHEGAERVRPAWKLLDTLELPKEDELAPPSLDVKVDVGSALLGAALTGSPGVEITITSTGPAELTNGLGLKRHPAPPAPTGFVAAVQPGDLPPLEESEAELIWEPGRPLPPAPRLFPGMSGPPESQPRPRDLRRCRLCGFEGLLADHAHTRFCPGCDALWI